MQSVFAGLLLILLDFTINADAVSIDLIPDFIGYAILFVGCGRLSDRADAFRKLRPVAAVMIAVSLSTWLMGMFGAAPQNSTAAVLLGIVNTAASIYASYASVDGVRELEARDRVALGGEKLYNAWLLMPLFQAAAFFTLFIPGLAFIAMIACIVFSIVFLVRLHRAAQIYG